MCGQDDWLFQVFPGLSQFGCCRSHIPVHLTVLGKRAWLDTLSEVNFWVALLSILLSSLDKQNNWACTLSRLWQRPNPASRNKGDSGPGWHTGTFHHMSALSGHVGRKSPVPIKLPPIRFSLTPGCHHLSESLFRHLVHWPKQVSQLSPKLRGMNKYSSHDEAMAGVWLQTGRIIGANHTSHLPTGFWLQMQMT